MLRYQGTTSKFIIAALIAVLASSLVFGARQSVSAGNGNGGGEKLYLPLVMNGTQVITGGTTSAPRLVNMPCFGEDPVAASHYGEMAVFWFGAVTPTSTYADVRVGCNNSGLQIHVIIFDRRLWYDASEVPTNFQNWDSVSIYLNLPGVQTYRFDSMLNWGWEGRGPYQAGYRRDGANWARFNAPFSTESGWRGNAPQDTLDDHGWMTTYTIPFTSLGFSDRPADGQRWGLGIVVNDRDQSTGGMNPPARWPEALDTQNTATWGTLSFGLPSYQTPSVVPAGSVKIRHGLNGAVVPDGEVGGDTVCGGGVDFWSAWGDLAYPSRIQINIQNQGDVADQPCFSKYYVTFPLDSIPAGKVILNSNLSMHQFGNSDPGSAQPSLIQVMTVKEDWNESTLTWNNAPLAYENVARQWVYPVSTYPGWPGVRYTWDLSQAVAQAYARNEPLRLVLYSSDWPMHSGKYFLSSDEEPLNAVARPTLDVTWGNP